MLTPGCAMAFFAEFSTSPYVDDVLHFVLGQPHRLAAHFLHRADRALITEGEFGDLAFFPERTVFRDFLYRHIEHLACRCLVYFAVGSEYLQSPLFASQPRYDAGLDG